MPQEVLAVEAGRTGRICVGEEGPIMDRRQENGRRLASDKRIKHIREEIWFVPSQSGDSSGHIVNLTTATCTCDDYELRRQKCKHAWAVEFQKVGTTEPPTAQVPRKTYKQHWPAYHYAQCHEKRMVVRLLRGLCEGILSPPHPGRGPKPLPLGHVVFAMTMRAWIGQSARRANSDTQMAADAAHIGRAPGANTVIDYYNKPELTPLLQLLIRESAAPLREVESRFAIDSTGFSTSVYRRWFDHKYGREMKEATWLKAHVSTGVITNVIAAATVTDKDGGDSPEMEGLIVATDQRFDIQEVSADKAYLSHNNLKAIEAVGAVPYIPFKSNSKSEGSAAWRRLWAMFMLRQSEFLTHYHQRSNVESTFSAVKRKFGAAVRSKTFTAQVNEVLLKLLCHNLSCLVQAMCELGIKPTFDSIPAPEVAE